MARFLLIRHGEHRAGAGVLVGRTDGVGLSETGRGQAAGLIERVGGLPIRAVYSSPVQRCRETAAPLAGHLGVEVRAAAGLNEVDFGDWTGRAFAELAPLPEWNRWNAHRSVSRAPGGESMVEVQSRVVAEIVHLSQQHGEDEPVALFSHGDVIRAAMAHFLGVPLDLFLRIEISLASVSVVELGESPVRVLAVNNVVGVAPGK
jgi:probable phosphomutase (TIGR03848 family)